MSTIDTRLLLHVMSYVQGVAIYAMLLAMVWPSAKQSRLILATAVLGLIWNAANVVDAVVEGSSFLASEPFLDAIAHSALGFLQAVIVHSVLRTQLATRQRWAVVLTMLVYSLSGAAALSHVANVITQGFAPSPTAEHLLGPAFGLVIIPLAYLTRGQRMWRRALWVVALSVVAVAGSSLAYHSLGSWWFEVLGHQASLVLAFAILYQDYRFALADLFLKRVLSSSAWSASCSVATGRLKPLDCSRFFRLQIPACRASCSASAPRWCTRGFAARWAGSSTRGSCGASLTRDWWLTWVSCSPTLSRLMPRSRLHAHA